MVAEPIPAVVEPTRAAVVEPTRAAVGDRHPKVAEILYTEHI